MSLKDLRNLVVKVACVIGVAESPRDCRNAGEDGGAGKRRRCRSKACTGHNGWSAGRRRTGMRSCRSLNWMVLDQVTQITRPHGRTIMFLRNKVLEGS